MIDVRWFVRHDHPHRRRSRWHWEVEVAPRGGGFRTIAAGDSPRCDAAHDAAEAAVATARQMWERQA